MPDNKSVSYTYDTAKKVATMTDYFGAATTYTYTGGNYISKIETPHGNVSYTYRKDGTLATIRGGTAQTQYSYDTLGRVSQVVPHGASGLAYSYDNSGNIVRKVDAGVSTVYNPLGQVVSTTDAKGNATTYEYDKLGRNIKVTAPFNGTTTTSTKTYYDGNGNVTKTAQQITSSTWKTTENTYDSLNRLETTRTGGGAYTQYEYDSVGNVTKMATGLDAPIDMSRATINDDYELVTYSYDFKNALTESQDALGQSETYQTDLFGNVKSKTDRNGNTITATYNPYGNILVQTVTQLDGTAETITNTYDILGNVKTMTDSTGTTNYSYDSFGRLTNESKDDIIKTYSYDAAGNRKTFSLAKNGTSVMDTAYTYDKRNLLTKVTNGSYTTSYTYDANGNLLTDTTSTGTTTYTYNNANLATKVSNTLQSFQYNYDLEGKIINCLENIDGSSYFDYYFYDNMGRLTSEETRAAIKDYAYDKYGNITSVKNYTDGTTTTRTYDKNNRLMTETAGTALTKYYYDPNGNTTAKNTMSIASTGGEKVSIGAFAVTNTDVTLYGYNGLNQLVSVSKNGLTSSYTYDGTGLRQSKTVNGVTTNHIWDGTNIVAESNGAYILKRYYRGANGLIFANLAGTETKYLKDGHGNITGLANMSGTTLNKAYCYDAFGVEKDINENDTNPFRYCGEYYDNEIDKIYLRARYYSPIQGRFITEDPIKDGLNWYAYCAGDPVNRIDITGLEWATLRELAQSLVDTTTIYSGDVTYNQTNNNSVQVKIGDGYYYKQGEFYYNGDAKIYQNGGRSTKREKIGENKEGHLEMERTDFYRAMNINYNVTTEDFTVTNLENKVVSIAVGYGVGRITASINPILGGAVGIATDLVVEQYQFDPGDYTVERILGEVYNPAMDCYEYIMTTTYYKHEIDDKGNNVKTLYLSYSQYNFNWEESVL